MPAPSLISYTETAWNTGNTNGVNHTKTSSSVAWNANDVIVFLTGAEGANAPGNPTATGLTFVSQKSDASAGTCGTRLSAVVAGSNGSSAITAAYTANDSDHWGFGVWVWRGSQGIGNSSEQHTSVKTVALVPIAADCAVVWGTFDFAAGALQTITPTPTNTRQRAVDTGHYTFYVSDLGDQVSGGSTSYGISGTGSGPFSIIVLEVQTGAAVAVPYGWDQPTSQPRDDIEVVSFLPVADQQNGYWLRSRMVHGT